MIERRSFLAGTVAAIGALFGFNGSQASPKLTLWTGDAKPKRVAPEDATVIGFVGHWSDHPVL
jgi:hypothetical protein